MTINFNDLEQIKDLTSRHEQYPTMLTGTNGDGELTFTSICENYIVHEVWQDNGHKRKMYYWADGTVEETYDGRWDEEPDKDCIPAELKRANIYLR